MTSDGLLVLDVLVWSGSALLLLVAGATLGRYRSRVRVSPTERRREVERLCRGREAHSKW